MVSPGSTRRISPFRTSSARIISSLPSIILRAVRGERRTSFSMPALARATVASSKSEPNCMIKAISPAAKSSSIVSEAISAMETSTSALISNSVTSLFKAPQTMGTPHKITASHAKSNGSGRISSMLAKSAAPEIAMHASCILNSSFCNIFLKNCIFTASFYTHRGIGIYIYNILPAKCNVNKKSYLIKLINKLIFSPDYYYFAFAAIKFIALTANLVYNKGKEKSLL